MDANETKPEKPKLWKESLRCFARHWQPWMKLAVWFIAIMAVLNFFFQPDVKTLQQMKETKDHMAGGNMPPIVAARMALFGFAMLVITVIQYYLFIMFFLSREQVFAKQHKPSHSGFWYFVGQRFMSILLTMLPAIIVSVIAVLAFVLIERALGPVEGTAGADKMARSIAVALVILITFLGSLYIALKYSLVGVLACGRIKSTLKASWALTENNWWRLFGNGLMLSLLMMLVFIPLSLLAQISAAFFPFIKPVTIIVSTVSGAVFSGVLSAFGCTACRILYEERRQTEPAFTLIGKD